MTNKQLPAEVQERIKADAATASAKIYPDGTENDEYTEYELGYIAGATAEVNKLQDAEEEQRRLIRILLDLEEEKRQTLTRWAQTLVDALEKIIKETGWQNYQAHAIAKEALAKRKGNTKEVDNG